MNPANEVVIADQAKKAGFPQGGFGSDIVVGDAVWFGWAHQGEIVEEDILTGDVLRVMKTPDGQTIGVVLQRRDLLEIVKTTYAQAAVYFRGNKRWEHVV